jgi:hypothetical protein
MTAIAVEDQVSGRGETGDGIGMRERPDLPIVRNTVRLSAARAMHSAMHQLAVAVASILSSGCWTLPGCWVWGLRSCSLRARLRRSRTTTLGKAIST